ncbi:MAG TPA: acyl-CoA dehydrogenase family protein [Syntrophales bacterium]|nr:acyl-CoA dehydrogenase family protein [Syntrophales bacterium]
MKSLYFTADHDMFRHTVRQFVEKEVTPHADDWEKDQHIPHSIWNRMGDLGFLGINFPDKYGGTGADFFYSVVFLEEIPRSTMGGFAAAVSVHEYIAEEYVYRFGTEELKQNYLIPAIQGKKIGALAITEPNTGSDVAAIRTRAVRQGDQYIINGSKTFITNGVFGDFVIVAAKTDTEAGTGGISLIIVDHGTPGFSARQLHKMGWHSSDTAELTFEDVHVPVTNRIGEENRGFYYIMECFQLERLVGAIGNISGAFLGLDLTLRYIKERQAFNRPLAKFQVIRHALADLKTELEAARQLTYVTAWLHSQGELAVDFSSMAKLLTSELAKKTADVCLQFFGGYGYMDEYLISRMYRDVRVGTIVGGTSEIMREIISRVMIDQVDYQPAQERKDRKKETASAKEKPGVMAPQTAAEILQCLPERFLPEKAGDWETVFHFDISGPEGGQFTVKIRKGQCSVEPGFKGEAKCIVTVSDDTYRDIELSRLKPEAAFMSGKIRMSDMAEMMQFTRMFKKFAKT